MRRFNMHPMTKDNLKSAFSGESQAHMKYLIFADKAEERDSKTLRDFSGL
jgi:rubrerythrin